MDTLPRQGPITPYLPSQHEATTMVGILPAHQKTIDEFFAAIAAIEKGFQYVGFSYLAVRFDARFVLLHGRVFLNTSVPPGPAVHFQSAHVRAGHYRLTELKLNIRELIDRLKSGTLPTPDGELLFPRSSGNCAASFIPLHPEGLQEQRRIGVLTIMGGEPEKIRQPDLD